MFMLSHVHMCASLVSTEISNNLKHKFLLEMLERAFIFVAAAMSLHILGCKSVASNNSWIEMGP